MPDNPDAVVRYGEHRITAKILGSTKDRAVHLTQEVAQRVPDVLVYKRRREALATAETHIEAGNPLPATIRDALDGSDGAGIRWEPMGPHIALPVAAFLRLGLKLRETMSEGMLAEIESEPIDDDELHL